MLHASAGLLQTKAEAEEAVKEPEVPETLTIWFYNNQGWDAVAAHIYNETGTMFGEWPGKQMTADSGNWYYLEVDAATLSQYYEGPRAVMQHAHFVNKGTLSAIRSKRQTMRTLTK